MTADHEGRSRIEQLSLMEKMFEAERAKYRYDIDDMLEPVHNKSGVARLFWAIAAVAAATSAVMLAVALIASLNCGITEIFAFLG